ncbi:hypothetical protein BD769DRAFT_1391082 [Suillus cothurnatus]|nr:hypothetical protein BD769DRAFT_1391082 [Suillus cothurnatus]
MTILTMSLTAMCRLIEMLTSTCTYKQMTQAAQWILMRIWIHIFLRMKLGGIQQGDLAGKYTDMEQDQLYTQRRSSIRQQQMEGQDKPANPSKLGYPPTWQVFLQMAKLEMQLQAVLAHLIPESQDTLNLAQEVLDAVLWTYHEKKNKLKRGYFPEYNTELKKVIIPIARRVYNIFPQGSAM